MPSIPRDVAAPDLLPAADKAAATFTRSGDANEVLKSPGPVLTAKNSL
jgi:hypothetical protein